MHLHIILGVHFSHVCVSIKMILIISSSMLGRADVRVG